MRNFKTFLMATLVSSLCFGCAEDFSDDINELNQLLDTLNNVTNEQQQKIDEYKQQIDKLNDDLDDANLVIDTMNTEVEAAKEQVETSKKETEKAKEEVDKALKEVNEATENAKKSEEAVNQMTETVDYLNKQLEEVTEKSDSQQKEINEYKDQVNNLNEDLNKTNDELNKTKEELNKTTEDIKDSIDDINEALDDINVSQDGNRIIYPIVTYADGSQHVSSQPFDTILNKYCIYKDMVYQDVKINCCLANIFRDDDNKLDDKIKTFWLNRIPADISLVQMAYDDETFSNDFIITTRNGYNRLYSDRFQIIKDDGSEYEESDLFVSFDGILKYCMENKQCEEDMNKIRKDISSGNYIMSRETYLPPQVGDIVLAYSVGYIIEEDIVINKRENDKEPYHIYKYKEIDYNYMSNLFVCSK